MKRIITSFMNDEQKRFHLLKAVMFIIAIICFAIFAYNTIVWAWCSDDAYHAYTMSKNWIEGHGFTPTIGKRVNVSTCPLWTIIVTFFMWIFHDEYFTGLILNLLFSWAAYGVLVTVILFGKNKGETARNEKTWIYNAIFISLISIVMNMSKAFISYTTSGLENPLLFFLSTVLIVYYFRVQKKDSCFDYKQIFIVAFIEGQIIFTRMDIGLAFIPLCIYVGLRFKAESAGEYLLKCVKRLGVAILGVMPFILWELFSFIYYGSFVPNTALAKLNTGFPKYQYYERGVAYYFVTFDWDCLVILLPVLYCLVSILVFTLGIKQMDRISHMLISIGILLYMWYIVSIGGDFMKGRHFTVIFWIAIVGMAYLYQELLENNIHVSNFIVAIIGCVVIYALLVDNSYIVNPLKSQADEVVWNYTDEREVYFEDTGLPNIIKKGKDIIWGCQHRGIQWYHGVNWYEERLYDPLLSRLPANDADDTWMVGHMERDFPVGYQETLDSGTNYIENDGLHQYYDYLYEIISGNIWSLDRIKKIIHLNMGDYEYLKYDYVQSMK